VHSAESGILADPRNDLTLADEYATEEMFDRLPAGWKTKAYRVMPAPAERLLEAGDVIDLGDRTFEVVHTPGHSPGGIGLFEKKTCIFLSGDIVYDGPLIDAATSIARPSSASGISPSPSCMAVISRASDRRAIIRSSTSI
jgi:glyoxylase-like metal-dependent hydrolase (beta-lactamase superfamily II)